MDALIWAAQDIEKHGNKIITDYQKTVDEIKYQNLIQELREKLRHCQTPGFIPEPRQNSIRNRLFSAEKDVIELTGAIKKVYPAFRDLSVRINRIIGPGVITYGGQGDMTDDEIKKTLKVLDTVLELFETLCDGEPLLDCIGTLGKKKLYADAMNEYGKLAIEDYTNASRHPPTLDELFDLRTAVPYDIPVSDIIHQMQRLLNARGP